MILALDPGPTETGWAVYDGEKVQRSGVFENADLLDRIRYEFAGTTHVAIEMIASYGMAVGRDVFETCVWIGRFQQAWRKPEEVVKVYRRDVKQHICGSLKAKDTNIRQALIDKLGPQGTKSNPGPTYGVKSHAWAALAVAVTAYETMLQMEEA